MGILIYVKVVSQLLGRRPRDPQGAGLPRGRLMEVRAVISVALAILIGMGLWWGQKQLEKQAYLSGPKPEQISTAAGKEDR